MKKTILLSGIALLLSLSNLQAKDVASLQVKVEPSDARIRILNIKPKFYNGIKLEKDKKYHLRIDKRGYYSINKWFTLNKNRKMTFSLKKKPKSSKLSINKALRYYKMGKNLKCKHPDGYSIRINKYTYPNGVAYNGIYVVSGRGANMMSMVSLHDCFLVK